MRCSILIVFCLAACMLVGSVSAETRIMIPEGSFEDTADLPVIISGITAATGVSFELSYDKDIVRIQSITASSEIPGSNVVPRIDNDAGFAKVVVTNTEGISAAEPASLVVIRFTRVGPGGGTVAVRDPRWSDTHFVTNTFDAVESGSIVSLETVAPAETAISSSGSGGSSSSSSVSIATPTTGSTATPAVTATVPGRTTVLPVSPNDTVETPPAASPGTTTESTQPPVTPKEAPGFCTGTVFAAGLSGIALLLYRRS